jgi:hypothetical protein
MTFRESWMSRNNREHIITDLGSTGIVGLAFSTFKRNGSGYLILWALPANG